MLIQVGDIGRGWKPSVVPKFDLSPEMNLFKDNIDYSVKGFADLNRLNTLVAQVSNLSKY